MNVYLLAWREDAPTLYDSKAPIMSPWIDTQRILVVAADETAARALADKVVDHGTYVEHQWLNPEWTTCKLCDLSEPTVLLTDNPAG